MSILSFWPIRTAAVKPRSAELKKLDGSVANLAQKGQGAKDDNSLAALNDFSDWKDARPAEFTKVGNAATELETELVSLYSKGKSQLKNAMSTNVKPTGWKYVAWDEATWGFTTALSKYDQVPAQLSTAETMRINESIRRVKLAVNYARDAMIRVAGGKSVGAELTAYTDYFGAKDDKRIKKVRDHFTVLSLAFDRGPDIVDLRNTKYGKTCYAACFRKSLAVNNKGSLSLSGSVNMFLGRLFFGAGNYEKTTDDTIGTLVHEFAHGACNAVDVPPVDEHGAWTHTRTSDDPNDNDFGDSTDNAIQASTQERDKLLAKWKPDYAVVNADNHGQFATRLLVLNKG